MLDLVRKRHDGDGWLVFSELANKPGGHDRYADAFALGVWASTKYESHLYEFKASRGDLVRELRDPTKAEGVGKYATYWWLAITDEKIMADLVIPEAWGVLKPTVRGGSRMLTVVRKAPKLKPQPFSPMFAVSLIRNIAKKYISNADWSKQREQYEARLDERKIEKPPGIAERDEEIRKLKRRLEDIEKGIANFREKSGIDLDNTSSWDMGNIGAAVKVVREHREFATGNVSSFVRHLSQAAKTLEEQAAGAAEAALALRSLMDRTMCSESCSTSRGWSQHCTCGAQPLSDVERRMIVHATE